MTIMHLTVEQAIILLQQKEVFEHLTRCKLHNTGNILNEIRVLSEP